MKDLVITQIVTLLSYKPVSYKIKSILKDRKSREYKKSLGFSRKILNFTLVGTKSSEVANKKS